MAPPRRPCYGRRSVTVPVPIGVPYLPGAAELRPFAAELWLVGGIVANLLVPLFVRRPNLTCGVVTLAVLAGAVASLLLGWDAAAAPAEHLRGMLLSDDLSARWKAVLLPFVAGVVVLWMGHSRRSAAEQDGPPFLVLLLGATLGLSLMASTDHLLMIFLAVAMASLPSYALAGVRTGSRRASEAALKYVLFGAVVGAVLAYGLSFLYGLTGSLHLSALGTTSSSAALGVGLVGLAVGAGFKASAVPLHFWVPDVFEGAPIEVTAFLSVASKGAGLVLLLRVVQAASGVMPSVPVVVGIVGAVTATVGNAAALSQRNVKRLLAYSSVAQAGYMLCALAVPGRAGPVLIAYLAVYAVMNLGAFAVTATVVGRTGSESVDAFGGLGRSSPVLAGSMLACLVSLIGLPPVGGFWAKLGVLVVLGHGGRLGVALIAVIGVNTVVSAFYYFRLVRAMYLRPMGSQATVGAWEPVGLWLGGACAAALAALFIAAGPLLGGASRGGPAPTPPLANATPVQLAGTHVTFPTRR
jgi:NADH-quinone oxidoreductase subunit N